MNCPSCRVPLIILELDQVEVDFCTTCSGVWLDSGELEILLSETEGKDAVFGSFTADVKSEEKPVRCPACSKRMVKVRYGTEQPVVLDRCPNGHGLWFDRGELEAVIALADQKETSRVLKLIRDIFSHHNRQTGGSV